ncbi:MAG: peptidase dimerization domain-containing protein, partial [Firmicutes bacterium]|nr:peptidase dimerization domain-containing protein [Bacillota bacterium]
GKPSHAAAAPEKGINALDACLATFHSINALREHVPSTVRMHGIITEGGVAANIVPERAVAQFSLRAKTLAYMQELAEKVKNCARAGALATGAQLEISNYEPSYFDMITNQRLQKQLNKNLNALGITDIKPGIEGPYSTDVGNVSHACPSIHNDFNIYAPGEERFPTHTPEFREASIRPFALEAMKINILGLVMTAADVIEDPQLLAEINEEFKKATAAERG